MTDKPLIDTYLDWLSLAIDAEGVSLPNALVLHEDGTMTVIALPLSPDQAYRLLLAKFGDDVREMVFAFDRFTKPGQGTTLADVMAGFHLVRFQEPRPFIVEYQHEPRIIRPVDWSNESWNAALRGELLGALRAQLGVSAV